ncbi:MAG TPA: OsmC family protein [Chitinophagaceae bacterium]
MTSQEKIKEAVSRSTKALSLRPSLGLGTGISRAKITDGLSCEITEGNYKLIADMPESVGGNATGPTPGVYGRAAFGSCLAIAYMLRASAMNIKIDSLQVDVQADYDDGALFGTSSAPPGYLEVRYTVTIESDATEDEILQMLDIADKHSPYLDVFARGQKCTRDVRIISSKISS